MTKILGLSAFHSDAAAALLVDGELVAAAQEERFTRKPRDPGFPKRAIRYCLHEAGLAARDLDRVVFYEKPLRKFERVLATQLKAFPSSGRTFARSAFIWLGDRLWVKNTIAKELGISVDRIGFEQHQVSLGLNALRDAAVERAAILTVDDAGEWATTVLGQGEAGQITVAREVHFPHSLGFVVSAFTQYLGFLPGGEEHLLEALSAHGQPSEAEALREILPRVEHGFAVDQDCFRYSFDAERLYSDGLVERLGTPRFSGDPLLYTGDDRRHADLAASLQLVLEERVLELAEDLHELVPLPDLCFAGELARNTRVIRRLREDSPFQRVHVSAAPGKAGAAIGAAWSGHVAAAGAGLGADRSAVALGEAVDDRAEAGAIDIETPVQELASRLLTGQRVGWVRGRMEFGSHSHGHRSVFAQASADGASGLLNTIQLLESFRPVRLAMPAESASDYVESGGVDVANQAGGVRVVARESLAALAPVEPDGTVLVEFVTRDVDPDLHRLLELMGGDGGAPLLLHADFAPRGLPLVRTEADAVESFRRSTLDALVVANRLYEPEDSARRAM